MSGSQRDLAGRDGGNHSLRGRYDATACRIVKSRCEPGEGAGAVILMRERGHIRRLLARSFLMLLLLTIFVAPAAFGADGVKPVASFTYSPSEPVTGQVVTFDGSRSTCASTPCAYVWSDDGADGPGGASWPLGNGQVLTFTFHVVGTKYVRLTVTDALGRTSTTEQDVTVASSQQLPVAPANTVAPAITGTPQEGQTLTASNGTWTGTTPISYTYAWSDGATGATDTLTSADVGKSLTVEVTATNSAGQSSATSASVGPVTPLPPPPLAPTNTQPPVISGTAHQGDTLTVTNGTWTGTAPISYGVAWSDGTTGSSDTLSAADVGQTITATVTASNSAGSTQATSASVGPVTAQSSGGGCDLNATTSNFAAQVSAATAGQTICLASGDYGTWSGTSEAITVTAASGASVTLSFGFASGDSGFTIDGAKGGGTMTIPGGEIDRGASNITIRNAAFTDTLAINGPTNANILLDADTFNNQSMASNCTGQPARLHLEYHSDTPSGVTVENSQFVDPAGGLSNARDGIQTGVGLVVKNNLFENIRDNSGCNHNDALQAVNTSHMVVVGNLFANDADGFVDFDDSTSDTATDNACYGLQRNACVTLYADLNSVVEHNTGGPGMRSVELDAKTGHRNGSGTIVRNNVGPVSTSSSTPAVFTNNLFSGAGSPNINGSPTFTGGTSPTTWAGFELTSNSAGHLAATDGTDVGIRASAGGPPTG